MALCDQHRANYHFDGETCMLARDLKPGDELTALGGSAQVIVQRVALHTEPGWTSVLLDVSPDPTAFWSDSVLSVRRPEPAAEAEEDAPDDPDVTVTVELTVTESVTYEFSADVEIPADIVNHPVLLHEFLDENEDQWLDALDPTSHCASVNERSLDEVSLVLAA